MSLKKFAGLLIAGKLMANTSLLHSADIKMENTFSSNNEINFSDVFNSKLTLIEEPKVINIGDSSIEVLKPVNNSSQSPYGVENAAQIILPGENCDFNPLQDFNLIITGVKPGDSVFIAISDSYDENYWNFISDKIKLGSNLKLLGSYKIEATPQQNPDFSGDTNISFPIRIKIKLSNIEQYAEQNIYIQAFIIPQESFLPDGNVDWKNIKASEVDLISVNYQKCDNYGSTY